jgi:hypothetical protein
LPLTQLATQIPRNLQTPSQNTPHIPEGTAQNSEKTPGKKPCAPGDAGGKSLPWQGGYLGYFGKDVIKC